MARKPISDATLKKLFSLSGNKCAFPGCETRIVDRDYNLLGQICHIEAAEEGGQRYNSNQDDNQRRSFDNLLILCANHHKVTDNVQKYPVEKLKEMKYIHEQTYLESPFSFTNKVLEQAKRQDLKSREVYNQSNGQQIIASKGNIIINNYTHSNSDNNNQNFWLNIKNFINGNFEDKDSTQKMKWFNIPDFLNHIQISSKINLDYNDPEKLLKKLTKKTSSQQGKNLSEILKSKVKTKLHPDTRKIVSRVIHNIETSKPTDSILINKVTKQNSKKLSDILNQIHLAKSNIELDSLVKLKDEGLKIIEKQKAQICYAVGKAYLDLLLFKQAKESLIEAHNLDSDNVLVLNELFNLALHLEDETLSQKLSIKVESVKDKITEIDDLAEVYTSLSLFYCTKGQNQKALNLYKELKRYLEFSSVANNSKIYGITVNQAGILLTEGKAEEAYSTIIDVLKTTIPDFNPDKPPIILDDKLARMYNGISISYAIRNQMDLAIKYSKAFKIILSQLSENHYTNPYTITLSNLNYGILQMYKGNLTEADKATHIAKDYIQDNIGSDFSLLANTYANFGGIHLLQNEKSQANKEFSKAIEILNTNPSRSNLLKTATIYCHQGNVYRMKSEADKAMNLYQSALGILANIFSTDSPNLVKLKYNLLNPDTAQNVILAF